MPEEKSRFLNKLLDGKSSGQDDGKGFSSERQHTAQAFNLHVERRDGRSAEGFAWSHYGGYQWTDDGGCERLTVLFGARALEIEGHNLGVLVNEIREGQLNKVKEMTTGRARLLEQGNPDNEPVISSVKTFPDFDTILKELKGEDEHEGRHARRVER